MAKKRKKGSFADEAERILTLSIDHRVNSLGGYGPNGEVIYEAHPVACPSVLADQKGNATAAFASNGSVEFEVKLEEGMDIKVLEGSFETVEKREIGVPSANVWLDAAAGGKRHIASLMNPKYNIDCAPRSIRVVKLRDPDRSMWYCARFAPERGLAFDTVVKLALLETAKGPALSREICVINRGRKTLNGRLWTYFNLHGTQRFVYNKELWYDMGLPVSNTESVVSATVPYSDIMQLKRLSNDTANAKAVDATCDYTTFVGNTSASAVMPQAVIEGAMLKDGAGRRLNRFATASIAANLFAFKLARGGNASVRQALLYVTDGQVIEAFREASSYEHPSYPVMAKAYLKAAKGLVGSTPGVKDIGKRVGGETEARPFFEFDLPKQKGASHYANSVWTGIKQLYEVCRAHGAKLADGIEIGTRDRGQDMWPKLKEDPGRIRADLVHAFSFMYQTTDEPLDGVQRLTLKQKLHGMFPRQFPSRWLDRTQEVYNDNRPYTDSPLWLINSLCMYIRETGDTSILLEEVESIHLTDPEHPVTSGIVGCRKKFKVFEVVFEIFACFERHAKDSPYGIAQILYGDWCDPIDMYGTSVIGDAGTRGKGRGAQVRLSEHLFLSLVEAIDILEAKKVNASLSESQIEPKAGQLKEFASRLRKNIVRAAWESGPNAGFIDCIHELRKDGSIPDYGKGEIGYTLGSMKGKDFDGLNRRQLASQAFGLAMLNTRRDYLDEINGADEMIREILKTTDSLFAAPKLGLVMFSTPIANNRRAIDMVGRMGVVPPGTAENGEYHHCQVFMHLFRLALPGQSDKVWKQFKYIMSAMRDESIGGPFDMPSNSYGADKADPHFGKGMYFGLSGSMDWMIEIFQKIAGLELNLHDDAKPSVSVRPNLPEEIDETLTLKRIIHLARPEGGYRRIPLSIDIRKKGGGKQVTDTIIKVNGSRQEKAEVWNLEDADQLNFEITHVHG